MKTDHHIKQDVIAQAGRESSANAGQIGAEVNPGTMRPPSRPVTDTLPGGERVVIRPIQPGDAEMEREFIEALSPQSRRFRFLETFQSPSDALISQLTVINPLSHVAYVAVIDDGHQVKEIGVGRFSATPGSQDGEFAIVVAEAWRRKGLGTLLMHYLVESARAIGVTQLYSSDSSENDPMRQFAAHLKLEHGPDPQDAMLVLYRMTISPALTPLAMPAVGEIP